MRSIVKFPYSSVIDYVYDVDGHRHVKVPIFFDKKGYSNYAVDFFFDTGAYLTVLTQKTAKYFGFDKIHFSDNPDYKPPIELKSGKVYSISKT